MQRLRQIVTDSKRLKSERCGALIVRPRVLCVQRFIHVRRELNGLTYGEPLRHRRGTRTVGVRQPLHVPEQEGMVRPLTHPRSALMFVARIFEPRAYHRETPPSARPTTRRCCPHSEHAPSPTRTSPDARKSHTAFCTVPLLSSRRRAMQAWQKNRSAWSRLKRRTRSRG